jgi:hypothetical protein
MVVNKFTNEFYIGYREGNKLPASQDILLYKTSSKKVRPNFHNFTPFIIAEFFTATARDDAYWFEQELIENHIKDPLCLNEYFINKSQGRKKFKSKIGKKCKDETRKKISNTKNTIDPVTGLTNAQKSNLKVAEKRKVTDSYKSAAIRGNITKEKNNSNIIGGQKASITKNTIDPITGLTNAQLAGIKGSITKNTIDPITGLTNAQLAGIKGSITKNTIDPITGLTNAQLAGLKIKETLLTVDNESGSTRAQIIGKKGAKTRKDRGVNVGKSHPNAKIIAIFDSNKNLKFWCHGNFQEICLKNGLPYSSLTKSYKQDGKPISSKKQVKFTGWFAVLQTSS